MLRSIRNNNAETIDTVLQIDHRPYDISVTQRTPNAPESIKILIPAYMMSQEGFDIVRVCIASIQKHTPENHEIWVIDNNSAAEYSKKLQEIRGISIVRNKTEPINHRLKNRKENLLKRLFTTRATASQLSDGSYANAIALEIGCKVINASTNLVLALHSDTLVTRENWLTYLLGKMDADTRAASFFRDKRRIKALHVSGLLFDFQLFRNLNMNFLPNIRQLLSETMPEYDVGDHITKTLKEHGYRVFHCRNTKNDPESVGIDTFEIPDAIDSDRAFDDENHIVFMHLGRGTPKSISQYNKANKVNASAWVAFADKLNKR